MTATQSFHLTAAIHPTSNRELAFFPDAHPDRSEPDEAILTAQALQPSQAPQGDALWIAELGKAGAQIVELMDQGRLMEADRLLFLTTERYGWQRPLAVLQEQLDQLHHLGLIAKTRDLLRESARLHRAGKLADAREKLAKAQVLALSDPQLQGEFKRQQEALGVRPDALEAPATSSPRTRESQVEQAVAQLKIAALIGSAELDAADQLLALATLRWGLDDNLRALYGRLTERRAELLARSEPRADSGVSQEREVIRLLILARAALQQQDRIKGKLLVAQALELRPGHPQAREIAQKLDALATQ